MFDKQNTTKHLACNCLTCLIYRNKWLGKMVLVKFDLKKIKNETETNPTPCWKVPAYIDVGIHAI